MFKTLNGSLVEVKGTEERTQDVKHKNPSNQDKATRFSTVSTQVTVQKALPIPNRVK